LRYLTPEQQRLLDAAKQSVWDKLYLLVLMAVTTGARRSELLKLTNLIRLSQIFRTLLFGCWL